MEEGLRVRRVYTTRDAEDGGERKETVQEETPTEEQTTIGQEETTTGQEGPKEPERRHVPGGTWLSQIEYKLVTNAPGKYGMSGLYKSLVTNAPEGDALGSRWEKRVRALNNND
ncbi:hypothetical protein NDU88_008515 [Pleurodeles waltl]|uniref:Uncharacterized protein n=1 Tax=Pleurodeles waltl TaxID=8319 RepID=A0AAV7QUR5_PLEWA|nr:hypothetical protein NDU88_008515 [Pleurodeles waltl]